MATDTTCEGCGKLTPQRLIRYNKDATGDYRPLCKVCRDKIKETKRD